MQGLFGPVAIAVICGLLFVEEVGVPLPMFPASGLLLVAGMMIAARDISPWFFIPIAYVANVSGATLGYTWARWLGQQRMERLADRLRLRRHLDAVTKRLHRAGSVGVGLGRILPGTRVYVSLAAGVTGMPVLTFMRGLLVADVLWVGVLVGLGIGIGIPAAAYLHVAMELFLRGVIVVIAVLASFAILRLVRPPTGPDGRSRLTRLGIAIAPDAAIVAVAALAVSLVLENAGVLEDWLGVAIVAALSLFVYVAVTRLAFRSTFGEWLSRASYRDVLPDLA